MTAKRSVSEKPDISKPIADICGLLGFRPGDVARLDMHPGEITVEVFKTNENGSKYIGDDGYAAKETHEIKVIT